MSPLLKKIKPKRGFAHLIYIVLNIAMPLLVLALVKTGFVWPAVVVTLLSKWRMFAVRPRFWWANIRTNAIDIIFGVAMVVFMAIAPNDWYMLAVAAVWAAWLIILKPKMSAIGVSLQALLGYFAGLVAFYNAWPQAPMIVTVVLVGMMSFFAAHHFFYSFEEPHTGLLSYMWGYFAAALAWTLSHWQVFYWFVAQPALILISLSLILGTMYFLDHFDKLSKLVRRQLIFIATMTILIIWVALVYYHWLRSGGIVV